MFCDQKIILMHSIFFLKELELYKQHLVEKPAIVAFNKLDMEGAGERLEEALELLKAGTLFIRAYLCISLDK